MKSFEKVEDGLLIFTNMIMSQQQNYFNSIYNEVNDFQKAEINNWIQEYQLRINNIKEVTIEYIGATTNSLINKITEAYRLHTSEFYGDFEAFCSNYIVNSSEAEALGVKVNDLLCFKGHNIIMNYEPGNIFRQLINANFGTNIPMAGKTKELFDEWWEKHNDPIAKDKAYVDFLEAVRDSGLNFPYLDNCVGYHPSYMILSSNLKYQEAKSRLEGRSHK